MVPSAFRRWGLLATAFAVLDLWGASALAAPAPASGLADDACRALAGITADPPAALPGPAACEIRLGSGRAGPGSLQLPVANWNGRLAEVECGPLCPVDERTICRSVVARGYACLAGDGLGRTRQEASALAARFYGRAVETNILLAASLGGGDALQRVADHPTDYAALILVTPMLDRRKSTATLLGTIRALQTPTGGSVLGPRELALLHAAALGACDAADGLADGVIGDPLRCRFDPAVLRCVAVTRESCLDARQIAAARRLYRSALPGSELSWQRLIGPSGRELEAVLRRGARAAGSEPRAPDLHAFAAAGGKTILLQGLADPVQSPRAVVEYYERNVRVLGGAFAAARALRLFLVPGMEHCTGGAGAYLIDPLRAMDAWIAQGAVRPPDDLIAFHPREDTIPVGSFFAPVASDPAQAAFSSWLVGSGMTLAQARDQPRAEFSRPIYLYPFRTRYKGIGDPHSWLSFYAPNDYRLLDE